MFRKRDPQGSLLVSSFLLPDSKRKRLDKTWAAGFRARVLPLLDEEPFRPMYCADNGRPNQPVQVVLGVLLLKEMFDFTDDEALEQLEFNLQWHHALRLESEEAHLCQKTLHNFRERLLQHDGGRLAFETVTSNAITALGIKTTKQRLDSTHVVSNIARLSRLGLFCETIRVFLRELKTAAPRNLRLVPASLLHRYLKDEEPTHYQDAASSDLPRRLGVVARDLYRLLSRFKGKKASRLESYALLERLFQEQCEVVADQADEDEDAGDGPAPVRPKNPKDVPSNSLQSPHDPDVTYSGHKGKGYEVQVAETCEEDNPVQLITHVEVTPACEGDAHHLLPTLDALAERGAQPEVMLADTNYGSAANGMAAAARGVELVAPLPGNQTEVATSVSTSLEACDFDIDPAGQRPARCIAEQEAIEQRPLKGGRIEVRFAAESCQDCPLADVCPTRLAKDGSRVLRCLPESVERAARRREQSTPYFRERYALRAGIEATNSELKRGHGLGDLRVRRAPRVRLAAHLKALACNAKRIAYAFLDQLAAVSGEAPAVVAA